MADFRLVKDQAANQSAVDYPAPVSNLPPPERRRLINNQSDAETQRLLRQARANDQSPAETQRLINQNARAAVSAFEAQTGENQSAAETARLLRQNSFLSNYTDTSSSQRTTANEDTGQRPSVKSNPVSNYPSFGAGNTAGIRKNPLDDYANYTYGITLFVGSASDYSPGSVNGDVMVASGGIRENRLPQFYEDFYFDSFKLESVIGLNAQSRSSNVITIEFTIVEPFGISLLDRLLDVADSLGADNWHEMVFTLKVDFYGNNDDGVPVNPIAGQTKHFQTKIIGCDIKATSRGSEYKFTAIPFSHQAYTQNIGTTPATHEANGVTVQDIFESKGLGSYANFLNKHQTDLAKNKKHQELADVYEFVIAGDIGKATIVTPPLNSTRSTPMPNDQNTSTKTAQAQAARKSGSSVPLEMQKQRVPINAGTSIIDAINLVVRNSTYISGQVKPGGGRGDGRVNWFKITTKIKYGDYDKKRNTHQKTITYYVDPYVIYNTKYPDAPMGLPPASKWSKEYNYIYTRLNQQIIDFSIDFNTMFYTMMTTSREKLAKTDVKPEDTESKKAEDKGSGQANGPKSISPAQVHPVAATDASTSQQGTNNVENIAANDLYKSLMSSSRGDMINVKLKIAGDPDFVKQDDIFYGPGSGAGSSIATDSEEVYIKIFFKAPTDIDQDTGLMDFSSYPDTVFSGIYRVLRVESVFERGQFTQTLDSIRLFGQENGGGGGGGGGSTDQRRSDAPSGAKEVLEGKALDDALREMAGGVEYSDEPARMDDIYESIRENPPVSNVTDEADVARKKQQLLNTAINSSRTGPTTVDSTNIEELFASGVNVAP